MQYLARGALYVQMAIQHMQSKNNKDLYHGPHCSWCAHNKSHSLLTTKARIPYLHPEPMFLHSSGRARNSNRYGLFIDVCQDKQMNAYIKTWQRGYTAKYGMCFDVELSEQATLLCDENLERAIQWVTRPNQRCSLITLLAPGPCSSIETNLWNTLFEATLNWNTEQVLWLVLDYAGTYRARPLGFRHIFTCDTSSSVTYNPTPSLDPTGGTYVVLYATGVVHHDHLTMKMLWQQALHQVIVNMPGHRSLHTLMMNLSRLLTPLGLSPVIECNRVPSMSDCYFGFEFLFMDESHND